MGLICSLLQGEVNKLGCSVKRVCVHRSGLLTSTDAKSRLIEGEVLFSIVENAGNDGFYSIETSLLELKEYLIDWTTYSVHGPIFKLPNSSRLSPVNPNHRPI